MEKEDFKISCRDIGVGMLGDEEGPAYELLTRLEVVPDRHRERLTGWAPHLL